MIFQKQKEIRKSDKRQGRNSPGLLTSSMDTFSCNAKNPTTENTRKPANISVAKRRPISSRQSLQHTPNKDKISKLV